MKLWVMTCRATQDGGIVVESSDKMWSTGEGNGKLLQHSCLENPMNSMKRICHILHLIPEPEILQILVGSPSSYHGGPHGRLLWISMHTFTILSIASFVGAYEIFWVVHLKAREMMFSLARLVHSLYAAGPTPCWHRTPCPVYFSQATKWEAQHAELYFQCPPSSLVSLIPLLHKSLG